MFCCIGALFYIIWSYDPDSYEMNIGDALFLTRNSIKEFKQYLTPKKYKQSEPMDIEDVDYPLNNMVNSIFPIDSEFEFNVSGSDWQFSGRYASFSPILNFPMISHYKIFPTDACKPIDNSKYEDYKDIILVVLRGGCTFVQKVSNIVDSKLDPKAIVIGNNEPLRGLVTMYSSTFNDDRSLMSPVLFITNESYELLVKYNSENPLMRLTTSSLGNWVNIMISMMLSPPLMIVLTYCLIKVVLQCRKIHNNKNGKRLVQNLPVFIYNKNHLIHHKSFYNYLNTTGQMNAFVNIRDADSSSNSSSDEEREYHKPTPSSSDASMNNFVINRINIKSLAKEYNILIMGEDFYPSFKCSICLGKFKPLKSRVLVLNCKHFFHERCLSNWLINFKRSCPLCNNVVLGNVSNNLIAGQENYNNYGSVDEEAQIGFDESSNEYQNDESSNEYQIDDYVPTNDDYVSEDEEYLEHLPNEMQDPITDENSVHSYLTHPSSSLGQTFVTASPGSSNLIRPISSGCSTTASSNTSFYSAQETISSIPNIQREASSSPLDLQPVSSSSSTISNQSTILQSPN